MTFKEYCLSKNIDASAFKRTEKSLWNEFEILFDQMHPSSFTVQKKFLINKLRKRFHLAESGVPKHSEKSTPPKVKIPGAKTTAKLAVPKPKIKSGTTVKKDLAEKSAASKPKITSKNTVPKPVITPKTATSSGQKALKPAIPGVKKQSDTTKKATPLKPKIPGKKS